MTEIGVQQGQYGEKVTVCTLAGVDNSVLMRQGAGSMSFQYHLSPAQARELAVLLVCAAKKFDEPLADLESGADDIFVKSTVAA